MANAALEVAIAQIDRHCRFSRGGRLAFQALLARRGIATTHPIIIPAEDTPLWHRGLHPLADYRSTPDLPDHVDLAIIGAGLTGASAGYHAIMQSGDRRVTVAVLDAGDPACEASGRNGGNFETIPENSIGSYTGLTNERLKFLRRTHPRVPCEVLDIEAARQATAILGLALHNRARLEDIVVGHGLDCDFSPKGWLFLANNREEEEAICDEALMDNRSGLVVEVWSRRMIAEEFGFEWPFLGRFIPGDGSYHPFKFVCGLLDVFLQRGGLLYARTRVQSLSVRDGTYLLQTPRGVVKAGAVIAATNAFTSRLLPELSDIKTRQSQIIVTENVEDRTRGRIVTSDFGPTYFNLPRATVREGQGVLLLGGGEDRPTTNPASRRRSPKVHVLLLSIRDRFFPELAGRPPSAEWVGPLDFTSDQIPAVGELRPGLVIAAGFNGYGGSYCTAAGEAAALIALGEAAPDWLPDTVFSPKRLLPDARPLLLEKDGLWLISQSISRLLVDVNRKLDAGSNPAVANPATLAEAPLLQATSGEEARTIRQLARLPAFEDFTRSQLKALLARCQIVQASAGLRLVSQGSLGDCCYALVSGRVGVEIDTGEGRLRLPAIEPGAIFGQIAMFLEVPRLATCWALEDCLLLVMTATDCRTFFADNSRAAQKFFRLVNASTIAALQTSNRNLMLRMGAARQRVPAPDGITAHD